MDEDRANRLRAMLVAADEFLTELAKLHPEVQVHYCIGMGLGIPGEPGWPMTFSHGDNPLAALAIATAMPPALLALARHAGATPEQIASAQQVGRSLARRMAAEGN